MLSKVSDIMFAPLDKIVKDQINIFEVPRQEIADIDKCLKC